MDCVQEIMSNQSTSRGGPGSCRGVAGDKFGKANGSQIVGEPGCHSWELGLFLVQGALDYQRLGRSWVFLSPSSDSRFWEELECERGLAGVWY